MTLVVSPHMVISLLLAGKGLDTPGSEEGFEKVDESEEVEQVAGCIRSCLVSLAGAGLQGLTLVLMPESDQGSFVLLDKIGVQAGSFDIQGNRHL
jgi:hypothetical protein